MIWEIWDGDEMVNLILCESKELAEQLTGLEARPAGEADV